MTRLHNGTRERQTLPQPSTKTATDRVSCIMARESCPRGVRPEKVSRPFQGNEKGADPKTDSLLVTLLGQSHFLAVAGLRFRDAGFLAVFFGAVFGFEVPVFRACFLAGLPAFAAVASARSSRAICR